ncbi:hypothetical protein EPA93_06875 [Ktedonosporobacter rubrisoli]|uniref:Amidohydrolase-related domain-containing protein n=1 Tax=Ktedonosporobacter rubrisoli TaxID=2509675 RepID=A0A4P6JKP9_KTERU|nr:amidohydrolase family protein [Ktedonosporobacter rubrisoli]QBD75744.1 hypothetical protein EPA93_06875 [Ktedonosporobacter rubrisoli]
MPERTPALIDFHSHYYETAWYTSSRQAPGGLARAWPLLTDLQGQFAEMERANIGAKVLSAPSATIASAGQPLPEDLLRRINDRFAELLALYPGRLFALATIDAFRGEGAANEVRRAIQTLGLQGICLDCAQGNLYLDAPQARPTFAAAAELDVPVFVHPVSPAGLTERLADLGHTGILLARGTENAASVLALLRSGLLDAFPTLKIVLPMIGVAALLFAGIAEQEHKREPGWLGSSPGTLRQRLYIDTMGFDLASLRFVLELLGAEHVLLGSDWPIMPLTPRWEIEGLLSALELKEAQKAAVLQANALRLLTRQKASR